MTVTNLAYERAKRGRLTPVPLNPADAVELAALTSRAWEQEHGSDEQRDACGAIVDWRDRRFLRVVERRRAANEYWTVDRLLQLLRETDPQRITARVA